MFPDSPCLYETPSSTERKEARNMKETHEEPPGREPGDERWQPAPQQHYFLVLGDGSIHRFQWSGTPFDYSAWQYGNCFQTRHNAEQAREALKQLLWALHARHGR